MQLVLEMSRKQQIKSHQFEKLLGVYIMHALVSTRIDLDMLDQVRFNQPSVVRGVAIQGRDDWEQWVTSYIVLYSINCLDFLYVTDNNGDRAVSTRTRTHSRKTRHPSGRLSAYTHLRTYASTYVCARTHAHTHAYTSFSY